MSSTPARHRAWVTLCREIRGCDPLAWFARVEDERFYWERARDGLALATAGCAAVVECEGPDRFDVAEAAVRELFARGEVLGDDAPPPARAALVGGFAFEDSPPESGLWSGYPGGRLVLPERTLARVGGRCFATWTRAVRAGESVAEARAAVEAAADSETAPGERLLRYATGPDEGELQFTAVAGRAPAEYLALVEKALDTIGRGDLEKVVIARSVRVDASSPFEPVALLDSLRLSHPSCAVFAVGRPGAVFLGATPERLVAVSGSALETAALAGSAPRGRSPEEDARLARELVESKKEQAEHAVVVREMRASLGPHCTSLEAREAPTLLQLEGIQHLETPMRGRLRDGVGILTAAGDLHPTPALGGAPKSAAVSWLAENEGLARGWYGGAVGWVDGNGGDLAVALRSALLRGSSAWCFAGAGIVPGSQPAAELRETRLKLRALLAPLMEL